MDVAVASLPAGAPAADTPLPVVLVLPTAEQLLNPSKPFTCPAPGCGRSFYRHQNLSMHARAHDGLVLPVREALPAGAESAERRFHCPAAGCSYSAAQPGGRHFSQLCLLRCHYEARHDPNAAPAGACTFCGRAFEERLKRLKHERWCGLIVHCTCGAGFHSLKDLTDKGAKGHFGSAAVKAAAPGEHALDGARLDADRAARTPNSVTPVTPRRGRKPKPKAGAAAAPAGAPG